MESKIREIIKSNKEIEETLKDCSDEYLEMNASLILNALDSERIKPGYKIVLVVNEGSDVLEWTYAPAGEKEIIKESVNKIKSMYVGDQFKDYEHYYEFNLNTANWKESRRNVSAALKRITLDIDSGVVGTKGLWLYGPSGTGKTYLAVALLNKAALAGKTVAYVNLTDLAIKTQSGFNAGYQSEREQDTGIEEVRKADYLLIDDIGSERPTPWFKENVLLPIIDFRYKSQKTTIFTSNKTVQKFGSSLKARSQNPEVEEHTNDKIVSRIQSLIENEIEVKI